MRYRLVFAVTILQTGCMSMAIFGARVKVRELPGVGRLAVPKALENFTHRETIDTALFAFRDIIDSFFWMGSNTPYRAVLAVSVGDAPDLVRRAQQEAGEHCAGYSAGACTYEVNLHKEPSWLLTASDPTRRVAMSYRVFQRHASREKAEGVLRAAMASFQLADVVTIGESLKRDAAAAAIREERMSAWFDRKGWPRPRLEETLRHGRCAYHWSRSFRPSLSMVCFSGNRPAGPQPDWMKTIGREEEVQIAEYRWLGDRWQLSRPGQELDITLEPWAAFRNENYAEDRAYVFVFFNRYFLYEGAGEETDHEADFLDDLLLVDKKMSSALRP